MIARVWKAVARNAQDAQDYLRHLDGHSGVRVCRFAGADPERAIVEPEARAVLSQYDDFVRHYEVKR